MKNSNVWARFCTPITRSKSAYIAIIIAIIAALSSGHHAHSQILNIPDSDNARFSVMVEGLGEGMGRDIILIPGLGSSRDVWKSTASHLKGHYRLHILNISGFAGEPAAANAQGEIIKPTVAALHDYITNNHLKPVIIGHSVGGLMALELSKTYPNDAVKLILVDSLPYVGLIFSPMATVETIAHKQL